MQIRPITTKADHRAALKEIERLMDAKPGTPAGAERHGALPWEPSARGRSLESPPTAHHRDDSKIARRPRHLGGGPQLKEWLLMLHPGLRSSWPR